MLDIRDSRIKNSAVLKPQDLLVTLKLSSLLGDEPMTFATMAASLSMSASEVFAATKRAAACHLLVERATFTTGPARYRPAALNLREFLVSGLRYVFPAEPGKATRGFRTAQDAPPLAAQIVRLPGDLPVVWPHPDGDTRGLSIKPFFRSAPDAARRDPRLFAWLALADALRTGDARVRTLATAEIEKLVKELDHARFR
jgi:hypothetical protein